MHEKPAQFPKTQPKGAPLKPITEVLLERRVTNHFTSEAVPGEHLDAILRFGAQAASGCNFQPWRFVVVRSATALRAEWTPQRGVPTSLCQQL